MTNKSIRNTLARALMTTFAVLSAGYAYADDSKPVNMKFAGSLLLNVEQQQVDMFGLPIGTTGLISIAQTKAVGSLGRADVKSVSTVGPPVSSKECPAGFFKVADITDNSIAYTFSDLSLLYGDGEGVICINLADGSQFVTIDGVWMGGTARFSGAEGDFSITIDHIVEISGNTQFSVESGRITGSLIL